MTVTAIDRYREARVTSRWDVERAVFRSDLPAPARLIVLSLLALSDPKTAVVPEKYKPSLTRLAKATGLGRSTVAEQLNRLETDGWVVRTRPSVAAAVASKERTGYALRVPDALLSTSPGAGLVQELDQPNQDKEGSGDWSRSWTSPGAGLELVQELDQSQRGTSPGAGHGFNQPPTNLPTTSGADKPRRQPKAKAKNPSSDEKPETEGQRVNRLAAAYTDRIKLSNFPAVAGVVRKAVRSGDYSDDDITRGLNQLADDDRAVTADSLRYAINGIPPRSNGKPRHQPYRDGDRNDLSDYAGYLKGARK